MDDESHLEGCPLRRLYLYNLDEDPECTCADLRADMEDTDLGAVN